MFRRNISFHPLVRWSHDPHPCFLSFRSSGLRRSAALAILPLLASCSNSTSGIKHSGTLEYNHSFIPVSNKRHRIRFLFRGEEELHPCLEPDEAAKAETHKQQEAISADRGMALPSYVSARHVVRNQANFPPVPKLNRRGRVPGAVREEQGRSRYAAAWVRAIDDNNVASGKVAPARAVTSRAQTPTRQATTSIFERVRSTSRPARSYCGKLP